MIRVDATIDFGSATSVVQGLLGMLGDAGRKDLHDAAATEVADLVMRHIRDYAQTHHDSADNIRNGPAARTGHLDAAADSVAKGEISSDQGEVTISSPGFRRALGPVTITPKRAKKLTIPVDALAYGKTVADLIAGGMKLFRPRGRDFLATTVREADGMALRVLYILKDEVTLKHRPEMLPNRDDFADASKKGVIGLIEMRLEQWKGAA